MCCHSLWKWGAAWTGLLHSMFQRARPACGDALSQLGCSTPCGAYGQALADQSARYYVMQFNPRRNYVMQWNFNVQRQVTPNTTVMVGYVGARGIHMRFQADDNNMVYPDPTG